MPSATASPTRHQHLQALALALVCAVLFLRDGLLPGRALVPHPPELFDVHMAEARARGEFDADDAYRGNVGMTDKYLQSLCWDRVMQDRFRAGELPRWTRDIGCGAAFVPQMAQPYQPINLLLLLVPSEQWYGWWFLIHQVLFGYFAYLFLRRLGCLHQSALLGLVVAALGLWTQCKLHHNVILTAALSVWPMLSAVHDLTAGDLTAGGLTANGAAGRARRSAIGWLALWTGLSWSSGFVVVSLQATYLAIGFSLLLALQRPRGERWRCLAPVGIGLALGAMLSLGNMLPVLLARDVTARMPFDAQWLAKHGLEWDHALSLCWPDVLSWARDHFYAPAAGESAFAFSTRMPWSHLVLLEQPRPESTAFQSWVETSFAIGLAPLGCVLVALFDRQRRALVAFFALAAFVAFGIATADRPFLGLAKILPGIGAADLRRQLFTVAIALVVLAALGADAVQRGNRRWPMCALLGLVAAVSVATLAWLYGNGDEASFVRATARLFTADVDDPLVREMGGSVDRIAELTRAAMRPGEAMHNHTMLATTAWRALLLAAAAAAALWLRPSRRLPAVMLLAIIELLHAGRGPVQTVPAARVTTTPTVLQALPTAEPNGVRPRLQRLVVAGDGRKAAALPGNLPGFLRIEDGSAYNPLPPARFEEFFRAIEPARAGKADVVHGGAGVGSFHDAASLQHPLCDLFGIHFVLTHDNVPSTATLVDRTPPGTGGFRLLERTTVLPRATFVRTVDLLPDEPAAPRPAGKDPAGKPASKRLEALARTDRDVRHRIVLEDASAPLPTAATGANTGTATVAIVEHRDERVVVRVSCDSDGYVRLADPYDAGWRACLDGTETKLYVADHYLRAVYVPAGEHEVVFTYDAARVVWPLRLSLLALAAIIALLVTSGRRRPSTP